MKKVVLFVLFALVCSSARAGKSLEYKTYDVKTGDIISKFFVNIDGFSGREREVTFVWGEGSDAITDKYILNEKHETIKWSTASKDSSYFGERIGNKVIIKGTLDGNNVDKSIKINKLPLYVNPKVCLTGFVLSGEGFRNFWGFRNDDLTFHKMKAIKRGEGLIEINGESVEAIRVYWTVTGIGAVFFHRTYWFRKSDGLYLRQIVAGGKMRELIWEK